MDFSVSFGGIETIDYYIIGSPSISIFIILFQSHDVRRHPFKRTLRAEALRSSKISREEEGTTYLVRSKGLCSRGSSNDILDLNVTKTHNRERTSRNLSWIFSLPKEPRDFVFGPSGLNILLIARFFLDILGYFELTPSTYWKHFCRTLNNFFQNADGCIFQFCLEARNDWLLHNRFPFDFLFSPSRFPRKTS